MSFIHKNTEITGYIEIIYCGNCKFTIYTGRSAKCEHFKKKLACTDVAYGGEPDNAVRCDACFEAEKKYLEQANES